MKNFEAEDTMNSAGGATEINYDKISISASVSITYGIN